MERIAHVEEQKRNTDIGNNWKSKEQRNWKDHTNFAMMDIAIVNPLITNTRRTRPVHVREHSATLGPRSMRGKVWVALQVRSSVSTLRLALSRSLVGTLTVRVRVALQMRSSISILRLTLLGSPVGIWREQE